MGLPRRGSRKITVDEHELRWLGRKRDGRFLLLAEHAADPGQRLVVEIPLALFPEDAQILSPAIVRQCVLLARAAGYDPDTSSGEHRLRVGAGQLDFARVDRAELTKRPVGRPRKRAVGEKRKPVYVSLEPDDRARLQEHADRLGVGLGTLARQWILERLEAEES
ncbi:MAG: hypothetical protein ACI8S6_002017 [Myxococcota bacterium]|jgi:hypothetical protein